MEENYILKHFQEKGQDVEVLSESEIVRVEKTVSFVPYDWMKIIDVGCGDGRIGNSLISKGKNVYGIDWASNRLRYCEGDVVVADICNKWPFGNEFDGAICSEVLEHLREDQVKKVVENILYHTKKGFIISVPAKEVLAANKTFCYACGRSFHIWGHLHQFESFDDVDNLVGKPSIKRTFIASTNVRRSKIISKTYKL